MGLTMRSSKILTTGIKLFKNLAIDIFQILKKMKHILLINQD